VLCKGATFTVTKPSKFKFSSLHIGKILDAVIQRDTGILFFRFYDFEQHGYDVPTVENEILYADAKFMLSNDSNKNGIKWTSKSSTDKKILRKKRSYWAWEAVNEAADSTVKTSKQKKYRDCSSSSSSESDDDDEDDDSEEEEEEAKVDPKDDSDDDEENDYDARNTIIAAWQNDTDEDDDDRKMIPLSDTSDDEPEPTKR
jgi:hypothetical protein